MDGDGGAVGNGLSIDIGDFGLDSHLRRVVRPRLYFYRHLDSQGAFGSERGHTLACFVR